MGLFGATRPSNYALVDIGSSSVGIGYVSVHKGEAPLIAYAARIPLEGEPGAPSMLRTLDKALRELTTVGGPLLHKLTGHAGIEGAYLYVGAPWQASELLTRTVEKEQPFAFTKTMLEEALKTVPGGRSTIIASLMNGYQTVHPVGKRVKRADTVVLASHIEPSLETVIRKAVRGATGCPNLHILSFGELAPSAIHGIGGGEDEYLALRVARNAASFAFVKRGLLAGVRALDVGTGLFHAAARESGLSSAHAVTDSKALIDKDKSGRLASRISEAENAWLLRMRETLRELAAGRALPRVLFLFAESADVHFISRLLNSPEIHDLWLSDEPLSVIPITPQHFDPYLHRVEAGLEDPFLDALALAATRG